MFKAIDLAFVSILTIALFPIASAKNRTTADPQETIRKAVELSDIWSTGPVRMQAQVKFMAVEAGDIEAAYEKIWISPKKWRVRLLSPGFNEVTVGGENQIWVTPRSADKPLRVWQFERALAALSQVMVSSDLTYKATERHLMNSKEKGMCVEVQKPPKKVLIVLDCVDPDTGGLKVVNENDWYYVYSDYEQFAGKLFPRKIQVFEDKTQVVSAQITGLGSQLPNDPKTFDVPSDSQLYAMCPEALGFPIGAKGGKLLQQVNPDFPALLSKPRISNEPITITGVISRDGTIYNSVVRPRDAIGANSALAAVRQWRFEPYTVCGNPVEVPTRVVFNFQVSE